MKTARYSVTKAATKRGGIKPRRDRFFGGIWLVDKLLKRAGRECCSLFVDDKFSSWILSLNRLLFVKENLPNVTSLSIVSADQKWIEVFGRKLRSLEIGRLCKTTFLAIQLHCPHLRSLTLSAIDASKNVENNLWESIGPTLESLVVGTLYSNRRELVKIREHCRKLPSIHILNPRNFNAEYMELLKSDRSQLEYATVSDSAQKQFENMVESCSNAKFRCYPDPNSNNLHLSLATFGPQLHDISTLCHSENVRAEELMPMCHTCTNVRAIQFVGVA